MILVTGGAGYIGSHAVKALKAAGFEPVIFDNFSTGHRDFVRDTPLIEGDLRNLADLSRAFSTYRIDGVLHFAGKALVPESHKNPAIYYDVNVIGGLNLLTAMRDHSVTNFIFSSTCATYGEPIETPIRESHPNNPINSYGQTKLAIEHALPHFERAYGIRSIRLRYFNAAGADPDGELGEDHAPEIHVIPRALDAAVKGQPMFVYGNDYPTPDGTCLRDYIHVADLADAHVRALARLEQGGASTVFNVGTERPSSVLQVIDAVEKVTGKSVTRQFCPRRPGDPAVLYADASRIRQELGWAPQRADLETIVADAWKWHSTHPHGYGG